MERRSEKDNCKMERMDDIDQNSDHHCVLEHLGFRGFTSIDLLALGDAMREYWHNVDDDGNVRISSHKPLGTSGLGHWQQTFDAKDVWVRIHDLEDQLAKAKKGMALVARINELENKLSIRTEQLYLEIAMRLPSQEEIEILKKQYDSIVEPSKILNVLGMSEDMK